MTRNFSRLNMILFWSFAIPLAYCAKSTLKVAVCNPGQVPYATVQENGTLTGYDVGNYHLLSRALFCPYFPCVSHLTKPYLRPAHTARITHHSS